MDRALDSLSSDFKPLAIEVLARLVERGVMTMIVQTSRTAVEHAANIAAGTSATAHSKHLPRKLRGIISGTDDDSKADAIDLCPFSTYTLVGSDKLAWATDTSPEAKAAWTAIRDVGEMLGLRSGARWRTPHDPGHLEFVFESERANVAVEQMRNIAV